MATARKQKNYRKRLNYVIAVSLLVLFYSWLGLYAHTPDDPKVVPDDAGSGNRVMPGSNGLVAGLRKDIPLFTPAEVRTCHVADPETKAAVAMVTASPIQSVSGFYREQMAGNGWRLVEKPIGNNSGTAAPGLSLLGEKQGVLLEIQLTGNAERTDIRLKLMPKAGPAAARPSSG